MLARQRTAPEPLRKGQAFQSQFEIIVPFTTPELTQAALDQADKLVLQLNGRIRVIAIQSVPMSLALDRPPVALEHLEAAVSGLFSRSRTHTELYLVRDVEQTWKRLLRNNLVVVIASQKRWWRTTQERLARMLETNGHEVVLIYPKEKVCST
jgi:hypothetical protein